MAISHYPRRRPPHPGRDVIPLGEQVLQAEVNLDGNCLPVLTIATNEKLKLDAAIMQNRSTRTLTLAMTLNDFITSLAELHPSNRAAA